MNTLLKVIPSMRLFNSCSNSCFFLGVAAQHQHHVHRANPPNVERQNPMVVANQRD